MTATVVDLFCGAGGSALGFLRAGFRVVGAVDRDPDACRTYADLIGIEPVCADLADLPPREAAALWGIAPGEVDVLLGCPPCQGFTRFRNGDGIDDPRNRLIFVFVDYVRYLRPRFVVFENVPGLLRPNFREAFYGPFRDALVGSGYRVGERVVDAADYGAPQHRRRLIVVAASADAGPPPFPKPTHGDPRSIEVWAGRLAPWRTVRDAVGHLPPLRAGEADPHDPLHRAPRMGKRVARFLALVPKDGGSRTDVPEAEWLPCHRWHDGHRDAYGRLRWDRPAGVITSGCCNVSKGRFAHPEQDRAITPREAALLQGFPPGVRFYGSLASICRQIGNAVPPPLAEAVARAIMDRLRRSKAPEAGIRDSGAPAGDRPFSESRAGRASEDRRREAVAGATAPSARPIP